MSSSPIILTPPSAAKVPITEKQEIRALTHLFSLVNRYQLGDEARLDTVDGAKGLSRKVKAVIRGKKFAAHRYGRVTPQ
jgi:hypothetical protein